jgi:predicted nucleic acid-binding protein
MADPFLDTNVLIYAFTSDPRAAVAQALLDRGGVISVQVLNEFANVARRKLGMEWRERREALAAVRVLCRTIVPLDLAIHDAALRLAERYGATIFDSLVVAAALRTECDTLLSEDMQAGMVFDGGLRVVNPFR